jgi:DNA replication protein DnaC
MITTVSSLVEKMQKSGRYRPVCEDEYRRLQREASARLEQKEQAEYKPDYKRIGMTELEMSLTWDYVKPNLSDGMKAVQAVRPAYARGFGMVFLWGAWGQAKTLVGKILTATAFRDGKTAAYANMLAVLDDIRLAFDNDEHKTTELIRRMDWWVGRDVLFIDEIDKTNTTPWASERIFELIDRRYQRAIREEALTVIASNKSDGALDGYVRSRLHDNRVGRIVELSGPDARKVMPNGHLF